MSDADLSPSSSPCSAARSASRRRSCSWRSARCLTEKSGPHQSRPRGHAGAWRDGGLCRLLPDRLALARRAGRRLLRAACSALMHGIICKLPQGQRHRHRHRHDALRHRPRLLLRQALHPAHRAAASIAPARRLDRQRRASRRRCRSTRCSSSASRSRCVMWWAFANTRWRPDRAHDRRQRRRRARHGRNSVDWSASSRPRSAASSPASAALSCRSTIPAAGTRACPPARA